MRFILIMTLAGVLTANASNGNRQLETVFENPKMTDTLMPVTVLTDGKFTLQFFVSIQPTKPVALRRRTVLTNGRGINRKEIHSNQRFPVTSAGHETIVRTQVANKNRTANEGRRKTTTTLPKNKSNRLSTTTARYPTSKSSEEEDRLPWESWKIKNVTAKGSIQLASNRTTSIAIPRARLSRIRTTPAHSSKDAKRTHFVVEQSHGNSPKTQKRLRQNQDQDPTVLNGTMFKLQEDDKDADAIHWKIAVSRDVKTEQFRTDGDGNSSPINSKMGGLLGEEPQAEVSIVKQSVVGRGSAFDQATPATEIVSTSTVTLALKIPVPLNQPISRGSQASDVTTHSEGQVFPVTQTVMKQTIRDSTVSKSFKIATPLHHRKTIANESEDLHGIITGPNADRLPMTETLTLTDGKQAESSIGKPIVGITHTDMVSPKLSTPINHRVSHVNESGKLEESSIEVEREVSEKHIVRSREMVSGRVTTVKVRKPSWGDSEERPVFWVRYDDEEDDFPLEHESIILNPADLKKKKVVIVNRNRDERGTGGQSRRGHPYSKKESPYFYYHYDTSNALTTGSSHLPLLIASVLFLFRCGIIAL